MYLKYQELNTPYVGELPLSDYFIIISRKLMLKLLEVYPCFIYCLVVLSVTMHYILLFNCKLFYEKS